MEDELDFERDGRLQDEYDAAELEEAEEDMREQAKMGTQFSLDDDAQEIINPSAMRERIEVR